MKSGFAEYVVNDLLSGMEGVRARAMFGGHGIYKGDTMFAIIADDELYYKVDGSNRRDFESFGSEPFRYTVRGKKPVTMSYWKLPAEILDDRERLAEWTEKAVRVAISASRLLTGPHPPNK
jgi:DNA transformation protein